MIYTTVLLSAEDHRANLWHSRRLHSITHHRFDSVRKALRNVRNLHLNFNVPGDTLEHFLGLMPNATCISLFSGEECFELIPRLGSYLLKPTQMFTKLDLSRHAFHHDDVVPLVRKLSRTLRELRLDTYNLTYSAHVTISSCTELRSLFLKSAEFFENSHLENLVRNNPNLEDLDSPGNNCL